MDDEYRPTLTIQYIDDVAVSNPSRLLCMVPRGKDPRDGFYNITFEHFARAVDHLARHLENTLGGKDSFDVFGFLSHPADFRYQLLIFAAMKIGWVAFYTSPRNSMFAHLSLLDQAKCAIWLVDEKPPPVVLDMAKQHPLKLVSIPNEDFYLTTSFTDNSLHYPYTKTFEQGRKDVFAIWHSSGSTGIPKVIPIHQSLFGAANALKAVPETNFQFKHFRGLKMFIPMPWFHAAAYYISFASGIFYDVVSVTAPNAPVTAELIDLYHQFADVDLTMMAPSIIQEIASNPSYAEHCSRLKYIANGGGPSTEEVGNILKKYTHPLNIGGATESGLWLCEMLDSEDFMYWKHDPLSGADFRPIGDEHFELWFVRDPTMRVYQPVFDTFPELQEWSTKDVYKKHPTKPNLWKLVGRTDDVIVLSTGEKVNSVSIEGDVCQHPQVNGAVAFGEGRFELGLLLEVLPENVDNVYRTIDPILKQINTHTVAHGRIAKNMILFSSPEKPFPRAGKGTVQKKLCLELYQREIEDIYLQHTNTENGVVNQSLKEGYENIVAWLENWITTETGQPSPGNDQDIFESGLAMDSLLVVRLARELDKALPHMKVLPQNVYANPTISRLAAYVAGHSRDSKPESLSREQQMDVMLDTFANSLPLNTRPPIRPENEPLTVAVTGTTGSLGTHLLRALLKKRPQVGKIYCLNRKSKDQILQSGKALPENMRDVDFLQINVSKPRLGLDREQYTELARSVDVIIHNAWDVNFNKSLHSFRPQVHGVRELIDLCAFSLKGASLHFMSTISTALGWRPESIRNTANGVKHLSNGENVKARVEVPEILHESWDVSMSMGYAESKHVSERLIAQACEISNIPAAVYRVGQIAGPVVEPRKNEVWQKQEWVPTLIQTSLALGVFPSDLGSMTEVDWIPVDILSEALVELVLNPANNHSTQEAAATARPAMRVFHTVNPKSTDWPSLLPMVLKAAPSNQPPPKIVSLPEWVEVLRAAGDSKELKVQDLTSLKMLPYFEDLSRSSSDSSGTDSGVKLSTQKTCAASKVLSSLDAVKPEWMELWMQQWDFAAQQG